MNEMADMFTISRALIDWLESLAEQEPEAVRATIVRANSIMAAHGKPSRGPGNKPRGVGFTFDEAYIMGSLTDHGNSIETAARAYWEGLNEDRIDANLRALYRHKKDLEDVGESF
jgi:hypothetical protein